MAGGIEAQYCFGSPRIGRVTEALLTDRYERGAGSWPSIAPGPLMAMSCRLEPVMKFAGELVPPGQRQHPQNRASIKMQINLVGEMDGTAQEHAGRNFHRAAAGVFRRIKGRLNGSGVRGNAIGHRAIIGDVVRSSRNDRQGGANQRLCYI